MADQEIPKKQAVSIGVQRSGGLVWVVINGKRVAGLPPENARTVAVGMLTAATLADGSVRPPARPGVCVVCECAGIEGARCNETCKGVPADDSPLGLCLHCIAKAIVGHTLAAATGEAS